MSETIEELESIKQELDTFEVAVSTYIEKNKDLLQDSHKEVLRELIVQSKQFLNILNWRVKFLREQLESILF